VVDKEYYYAKERDPGVNRFFDPETMKTFAEWNGKVFAPGRLDKKTKELVAVACTYLTRCPYCIAGHTKAALEAGATKEEVAEVIQIAAALNAGAAIAHRNIALEVEV
jgi:AhpD family alkylhydroperoxidase